MKHVLNRGTLRVKASQVPPVVKLNRAALSALDVTGYASGTKFEILCGATLGDGGQGSYTYDSASSIAAVPGIVIIPAVGPGRLLLDYTNIIDPVKQMGADPTGHVDATSIVQAALDFASTPTYGWAVDTGDAHQATLTVQLSGALSFSSSLYMRPVELCGAKNAASMWGDYGAHATLHIRHGGHGIIVDMPSDAPKYRTGSIRDLFFTGYSETYQTNKREIKDVVSRFIFDVLDADAPPTLDDGTLWASHNTCFFFDPDGSYLGSGRVLSTAASPTVGRTRVTIANDGSDTFSSINNTAGDALTTACKVVWPIRITDESAAVYGISDFNDPAAAGSCAIFVKSTTATYGGVVGNCIIKNIVADRFHCGLRIGPKIVGHDAITNIVTTRNRFAGISFPRPLNTTDLFFTGQQWYSSEYRPDYGFVRTQGAEVTFTAGTPGTVNLTAHGFRAGSAIRFTAASGTLMTGLVLNTDYFVSSNALTADSFRVTRSFQGPDVDFSGTNSVSIYISGSVVDTPGLRNGPYCIHGVPSVSRWGSILTEFASYAGVYFYRTLSVNIDHLYSDSAMRALVFGRGYNTYVAPTTSSYSGWACIDRLEIKTPLSGTVFDTTHPNRAAIEFEANGSGGQFNGLSVGQLVIAADSSNPDYPYAFNLQSTSYNNRVIVQSFVEKNGYTTMYAPSSKAVEFGSHIGIVSASEVQRGWYDDGTKRAFALASTDIFTLDSNGGTFGNSAFSGSPLKSVSNSGNAITMQRVGGSPQVFSLRLSQNAWRWHDDDLNVDTISLFGNSSINQLWIGSFLGNSSAARSSNLYSEGRTGGVDLDPSDLNIVGPAGTGASTANGTIKFWTANPTTSGSTVQSVSLRFQIKRTGQLNLANVSTPTNQTEGDLWFNTTKGFRQYFGASEKPVGFNRCGSAVLVAGTVTVTVGAVLTSNADVLITSQIDGGTPGWLRISAKTVGTSFTITSSSNTDTSTVFWAIVEK